MFLIVEIIRCLKIRRFSFYMKVILGFSRPSKDWEITEITHLHVAHKASATTATSHHNGTTKADSRCSRRALAGST